MESNPTPAPASPATPRQALLLDAATIVSKDWNTTYDEPERNFERIAAFWNLYLDGQVTSPITPYQVAFLMGLVKVARDKHHPHRDNRLDLAGYMACAEEVAQAAGRQAGPGAPSMDPTAVRHRIEVARKALASLDRTMASIAGGVADGPAY